MLFTNYDHGPGISRMGHTIHFTTCNCISSFPYNHPHKIEMKYGGKWNPHTYPCAKCSIFQNCQGWAMWRWIMWRVVILDFFCLPFVSQLCSSQFVSSDRVPKTKFLVKLSITIFSYASSSTPQPCERVSEWAEFPTSVASRLASLLHRKCPERWKLWNSQQHIWGDHTFSVSLCTGTQQLVIFHRNHK